MIMIKPTTVTVEHYIFCGKECIFSEINGLKYTLKLLHVLIGKIQIYNRLQNYLFTAYLHIQDAD
jgi:hypothetical protein